MDLASLTFITTCNQITREDFDFVECETQANETNKTLGVHKRNLSNM